MAYKMSFQIFDDKHKKVFSGDMFTLKDGLNSVSFFKNKKLNETSEKPKLNDMFNFRM